MKIFQTKIQPGPSGQVVVLLTANLGVLPIATDKRGYPHNSSLICG